MEKPNKIKFKIAKLMHQQSTLFTFYIK